MSKEEGYYWENLCKVKVTGARKALNFCKIIKILDDDSKSNLLEHHIYMKLFDIVIYQATN